MRTAMRRAITLIEMLVALVITLMMMGVCVSIFAWIGSAVRDSRAIIGVSESIRKTRNLVQNDLRTPTATMQPPRRPESDEGYFEYLEGPIKQTDFGPTDPNNLNGDTDDVLFFTTSSRGDPFIGRGAAGAIESRTAEIAWFCVPQRDILTNDPAKPLKLYKLVRRVMLVAPSEPPKTISAASAVQARKDYYGLYDVSARIEPAGAGQFTFTPNYLGDLTKRENRFAHPNAADGVAFPFEVIPVGKPNTPLEEYKATSRQGEDVIQDNVVCFDVRLFDPGAPIYLDTAPGSSPIGPADYGYPGPGTFATVGAEVDLGYSVPSGYSTPTGVQDPMFAGLPLSRSKLLIPTYDTWSLHYENDGVDTDIDAPSQIDEGIDGLDTDGNGAVDDANEYETHPPYQHQLKGLTIRIRVYEPDTKQVREVLLPVDFMLTD
jgi:hypothetical protein